MSHNSQYSQAARALLKRRVAGTKAARLDERIRPNSIAEALAVQAQMAVQSDDKIGAWKCLLPPLAGQLVLAPIFAKSINRGASCKLFADNKVARI